MRTSFSSSKGIGLVEILITMFVLAVGVVGVAGLNSVLSRQSLENKARAEAQSLAQSRIEQVRNYTNGVNTPAGFNAFYAPVTNGNSTPIPGVNADFIRTETIADNGLDKNVEVNVAWTDADGDPQVVRLNTTVSYISPRTVGDSANVVTAGGVNAPTGRATIGAGTLPNGATPDTNNNDGTALYEDDEDLKLVDCATPSDTSSCEDIVLTLANACISDPCTQFAKIQGKVYINTSSSGQYPAPSETFLVASDAAYCARYYMNGTTVVRMGSSTAMNALPSSSGTGSVFKYFNYTCYVGGGWHGNIGFVFKANGNSSDPARGVRGCIGDPTTSASTTKPRLAIRRAYRGLLFKYGPNGPNDTHVQINNRDRLFSHGIRDGAQLSGHDFVLAKADDDAACKTEMQEAGSGTPTGSGSLFAGQPRDFFCLNNGYLDLSSFDPAVYGFDTVCPFDPTNPPASTHKIRGVVRLTATFNTTNSALANGITVKTSDAIPCTNPSDATAPLSWNHNGTYYEASYSCSVYDWSNAQGLIGWTGDVQLAYDAVNMSCVPNKLSFSALKTDSLSGNDFTNCSPAGSAVWQGTVSTAGAGSIGKSIKFATMTGTGSSSGTNGTCEIAVGGGSYKCTTAPFNGTWTGTLNFTSWGAKITSGELMCPVSATDTKTYSVSGLSSTFTQNLTIGCDQGGSATWSGTVTQLSNGNSTKLKTVTLIGSGSSLGTDGTCTTNGTTTYSCSISLFLNWSGTLNFKSEGGAICPFVSSAVDTKTYNLTNQLPSANPYIQNLRIGKANGSECP